MIQSFLESWSLFQNTYLAGWMMVILLSMAGVLIVARDQIFIGAALSQASTLGIVIGMWLGSVHGLEEYPVFHSDAFLKVLSCAATIAAATIISRAGEGGRESYEALTGWIFLFGGSVSVLIVAHSPHSLEEVHRLLSSSIIGSSGTDVAVFAVLAAGVAGLIAIFHRPLLLVVTDVEMAQASGMRTGAWAAAISCGVALIVSLCLQSSGLPYTFGCLVLPSLAARNVCRRPASVFLVAPAVGFLTSSVAFVLANHYNEPPGQVTVALLCFVTAAAWGWRRLTRRG